MIIHFVYINHYAYQLYDFTYINYFMDSLSKDIKNDMLNGQKTIFYQLIAQEVSLASKNSDATFGLDFLNHTQCWCSVDGYAGRITTVFLLLSYMRSLNSTKYWENLFHNSVWPDHLIFHKMTPLFALKTVPFSTLCQNKNWADINQVKIKQ